MESDRPLALHLLVRRSGGGAETNIRRLCDATPGFHYMALEESMGFPLQWSRLGAATRAIRAANARVVFCYGVTAHAVAAMALPWGTPLIGGIRCESDFAGAKGLLRVILSPRFSTWVSNSHAALGTRKGIVIHNGIPVPPGEKPLLTNLKKPVFGLLGRGHPKKGHRFLLNLWEEIGRPGSLVFAGELPPDLEREAESRGAICTGFVEPGSLLRSLDLLLAPSTAEGIPTVLLEAMARGIPCLAAPAGGTGELLRHGENGYLLERDAWREFLPHIDWNQARRLANQAREDVIRDFGFERMRADFLSVAEEFAAKK